jgi:spore coat polysaccharide biosynthesis predicted glycosyltransferase SpsG
MNKRYVFQCNATVQSGLGHLTRCINIAKAMTEFIKTHDIVFLGEYTPFAMSLLTENSFSIFSKDTITYQLNDILILDDYELNQSDVDSLRIMFNKVIKIDDFNDHDLRSFDLVINYRYNAEKENYSCKSTCLGMSYFPFSESLIKIREKKESLPLNDFEHVFVFIGGTDRNNSGYKLIQILDRILVNKHIYLIDDEYSSCSPPYSKNNHIAYLPFIRDISSYYEKADVLLSGGGGSKYEAAFCGIPNAVISQTEEQAIDTQIFADNHLTFDLGLIGDLDIKPKKVESLLKAFLCYEKLNQIKSLSYNEFCIHSTKRLVKKIIKV